MLRMLRVYGLNVYVSLVYISSVVSGFIYEYHAGPEVRKHLFTNTNDESDDITCPYKCIREVYVTRGTRIGSSNAFLLYQNSDNRAFSLVQLSANLKTQPIKLFELEIWEKALDPWAMSVQNVQAMNGCNISTTYACVILTNLKGRLYRGWGVGAGTYQLAENGQGAN